MPPDIIVVGAGIASLSLSLVLHRVFPTTAIVLHESHGSPSGLVGGGLGLAPNGLRALSSISPAITEFIRNAACSCARFAFRNSRGKKLGEMLNGSGERYGKDCEQVMCARALVHEALLEEVKKIEQIRIHWGHKVMRLEEVSLEEGEEMKPKVRIEFADGTVEWADLVFGGDGVRSVTRTAVLGKEVEAEYRGLTGTGGFLPITSLPAKLQEALKSEPCAMTFGPNGFFGYSLCDSAGEQIQWWSTFEISPAPDRTILAVDIRRILLERHQDWTSPHDDEEQRVFESIVELTCSGLTEDNAATKTAADQGVLILPVYITPRLERWGSESGRIWLLGDSAHAMPPDSGQGVSQAVEDAVTIALLLEGRGTSAEGLAQAMKDYQAIRMPRVHKILDFAKRMGEQKKKLSTWEEKLRDFIMWVICKLPESLADSRFAYDAGAETKKYLASHK